MADACISDQDQFICPVCLELLKDPVTTPCGHSFCKVCINSFWNKEDQKKVYSCPQCRETFTPRPVLRRNNMLAEVVEKLKMTASAVYHYAGPGDVECDSCIGRKRKATNSCLVCLASYCEDHLKPHYQSQAFKKHKLVDACVDLQEKICSQHDKLIDIYCRTDRSFICYLCTLDKHRGHDNVTANVERTEKQNELKEEQMKSQQKIKEKQKKVQEMKQSVDIIKTRSQAAVDDNEKIFHELINSVEKRRSEVREMIRAQEKAELSRANRLLKHLEQEIADLQRRVSDLEQLSHTPDHIHFLQSGASKPCEQSCTCSVTERACQLLSFCFAACRGLTSTGSSFVKLFCGLAVANLQWFQFWEAVLRPCRGLTSTGSSFGKLFCGLAVASLPLVPVLGRCFAALPWLHFHWFQFWDAVLPPCRGFTSTGSSFGTLFCRLAVASLLLVPVLGSCFAALPWLHFHWFQF
ncbi:tripartite motif-containing protein 16-like [Silurus asotus]|uniref:Tripartite motif-containing protein 16-like n=1 Tax=Silurus asotus TaxID=30991 RepID=A0AAD5B072_SILAS|nr:tripartite motif-containing protein 16-like [Silurus asotus]